MGLSRILCKRSPRVQTAETGMRRQRSDRCRLFSTITPTEPDVKGGEAGLLAAFTQNLEWSRLCLFLASVHLTHPFHLVFGFQLLGHTVLLCPLSIGTLTHAVSISKAADTISIMVSSLNALSFFSVVLSFSGAAVKLLHLFLHDFLQEVLHSLRRVLDGGDVILRLFAQLVIAAFPEC